MIKKIPIFICHYSPLEKRKKYLESILLKYKDYFDIEWITEKDISIIKRHFNYSKDKNLISKRRLILKNKIYGYNEGIYNVSFPAQELTLQHLEAIRRIKDGESEGGIIIEDDVVFLDANNILKINDYVSYLNKNGDLLFFGRGNPKLNYKLSGLSRMKRFFFHFSNKDIFLKKNGQSNYSDSYYINKKFCNDIFKSFNSFCMPIDWELTFWARSLHKKVYWLLEGLTVQGSFTGNYKSNLDENRH